MKTNYPEEYDRGWVEFYYQHFQVNEHVLIPRFETEDLVREAIKFCRATSPDVLIDIGTGSGIIPLSILSAIDIPKVFAVDVSSEALKVAEENNRNQGKVITFLEADLLETFIKNDAQKIPENVNILIVANLPYIKNGDWENMSRDTEYEPKIALFGGEETGFELYEKLFAQIPAFLEKYHPEKLTLLAEMGDDQETFATKILAEYGWKFSFFADCFGIRRFMKIRIK
ncbi:MAG: peptide chain release factor N(5)-glutamine methyltransferase [Candidatus Gracilibacteria bacterium]|nr:peptide chain release factor N(5)-glutamine methyltransferase [Candidatus Gracilibacteria bacterium]